MTMRARLPIWLLGAAALLGACGTDRRGAGSSGGDDADNDDDAPAIDAAPGAGDAAAVGTAGCGATGAATGLRDVTTTVAGVERHYLLFVPDGYVASTPTRLIFVFHGLGGDGALIRSYFGFEDEADGQALFVYPDGLLVEGGTGWSASDLPFFDAILGEVSAAYCIDPARVFATGHSYGGYMSNLVGCQRGDVVRGIAPVSGGLLTNACDDPVAAWIAHGDADTTVSQAQGIAARDRWIGLNDCATASTPTEPAPCVAYDGCADGYPVTWCSFAGGHYPLPSYTGQAIWDFFADL
jgi:polyhydroxybutyrate depolymerase